MFRNRGLDKIIDTLFSPPVFNYEITYNHPEKSNIFHNFYVLSKGYVLEVELPGVEKKDININIENGILKVSGYRHRKYLLPETPGYTAEEEAKKLSVKIYQQGYFGEFEKLIDFSQYGHADFDNMKAEFENGILTINFPRKKENFGKTIEIN